MRQRADFIFRIGAGNSAANATLRIDRRLGLALQHAHTVGKSPSKNKQRAETDQQHHQRHRQ